VLKKTKELIREAGLNDLLFYAILFFCSKLLALILVRKVQTNQTAFFISCAHSNAPFWFKHHSPFLARLEAVSKMFYFFLKRAPTNE